MFGNDNSQQGSNDNGLDSHAGGGQLPTPDPSSVFPPASDNNDPFGTTPSNNNGDGSMQAHPDDPSSNAPATNNPFSDVTAGAAHHSDNDSATEGSNQPTPQPSQPSQPSPGHEGLIGIKQEALQQLSPLVKHLNQSAEEKFKTTMMMIQASDNQDLVPEAFEAAKAIEDDKARAQALLDIINEINYFTQNTHHQ